MKPLAAVQMVCGVHQAQDGHLVVPEPGAPGAFYMPEDVPIGFEVGPDPSSAWGVLIATFRDFSREGEPLVFALGGSGGGTLLRKRTAKVHAYRVATPQPCARPCDGERVARALFHLLQVRYGIRQRVDAPDDVQHAATEAARIWGLLKGHELSGAGRVWLLAEARFQGIELEPAASPRAERRDQIPGYRAIEQAMQLVYRYQGQLILNAEEMTELRHAMSHLYESRGNGALTHPDTRAAVRSLLNLTKAVLVRAGGVELVGELQRLGSQ